MNKINFFEISLLDEYKNLINLIDEKSNLHYNDIKIKKAYFELKHYIISNYDYYNLLNTGNEHNFSIISHWMWHVKFLFEKRMLELVTLFNKPKLSTCQLDHCIINDIEIFTNVLNQSPRKDKLGDIYQFCEENDKNERFDLFLYKQPRNWFQ